MPNLRALATALPRHVITQAEAREGARRIFAERATLFRRMETAFDNAGIETRYSCVPVEWYFRSHSWPDRMTLFIDNAVDLLQEAAERCLDEADLTPEAVDVLIVVCSTGISTPSLDALLMERLPFRRDVARLPIFGLGCAGGVLGLGRAAALARSMPEARVLFLAVELCGLTFRRDDLTKSNIIATALFGDGAAAALIENDPDGGAGHATIRAWGEHTWRDSLDVMGWSIEEDGLGVIFSRDIPTLVRRDMRIAADGFLARHGHTIADLDGMICHPGGTKVVQALISADKADLGLTFERAAAIDLAGRDVFEAVQISVNPEVIETPKIAAVAKDGIVVQVTARVTVRANLDRLVGGATENTILARVGEGIVTTVGSAANHKEVLENPDKISKTVLSKGLDSGTAFEILSIDIADVDVGDNIGAKLQTEQAEADLKVARAKAEERRAMAVAQEQENRAKIQEMQAKVVEAEADVPKAMAEAFRNGNMGIMDYYNMKNVEADTNMRRTIAGEEKGAEEGGDSEE